MNSLRSFGVGVVSLVLILVVVVGGYNLLALSLGTVTGDYFKGALAVVVLLGGAWLTMQGLGMFGKPFMVAATVLLVAISVKHRIPGVAELFVQTAKAADRTALTMAVDLNAARVIPCDRTTRTLRFFDRESGVPLVWFAETEDGRLICYDRPGFHPQTRRTFAPADERLVRIALLQEPVTPHPTPAPPAAPAHEPQPTMVAALDPPEELDVQTLPELGGRTIGQ